MGTRVPVVGAGLIVGFLATLPAERIVTDHLFGLDPGAVDVRLNATLVIVSMTLLAAGLPGRRTSGRGLDRDSEKRLTTNGERRAREMGGGRGNDGSESGRGWRFIRRWCRGSGMKN